MIRLFITNAAVKAVSLVVRVFMCVSQVVVIVDGAILSAIPQVLTRSSANKPQFPVNDRSLFTGKSRVIGGASRPNGPARRCRAKRRWPPGVMWLVELDSSAICDMGEPHAGKRRYTEISAGPLAEQESVATRSQRIDARFRPRCVRRLRVTPLLAEVNWHCDLEFVMLLHHFCARAASRMFRME
jgi:hypothetical protein